MDDSSPFPSVDDDDDVVASYVGGGGVGCSRARRRRNSDEEGEKKTLNAIYPLRSPPDLRRGPRVQIVYHRLPGGLRRHARST